MDSEMTIANRQKMIDRIEGHCGTLGPMNEWTYAEIEKLYQAIYRKEYKQ